MTLYWIVFLLPALAAMFPRNMKERQALFAWATFGAMLALFVGLRQEVGGDWFAYEESFWRNGSLPFIALLDNIRDPGYYWSGWLLYQAGSPIHVLNLFCATLLSWGLIHFCRTLPSGWLGVVAAIPYLVIVVGMGYTRQAAAIGLVLVGLAYINKGSVKHFVLFVLLAALMHRTALVLLPLAVVAVSKGRLLSSIAVGVITLVAANVLVADEVEQLWGSYVGSSYSQAADGAPIRVLMSALSGVLFLIFRRSVSSDEIALRFWTALSLTSLACLPLLAISLTAVDRIALYLLPLQVYVAGSIAALPVARVVRTGVSLLVLAVYAAVLFVWINFANHAMHWLPYESILWSQW